MGERTALRVFHLPALVGDHGPSLALLERQAGLCSVSVSEAGHPFGFRADIALRRPGESALRMELRRLALFLRILWQADVVHYNWGRTLFPDLRPRASPAERHAPAWLRRAYRCYGRLFSGVELRLLRWRGIRIVVTFQGSDARRMDACRARGAWRAADAMESTGCTAAEDAWKQRIVERFDRFAHAIFSLNPDLCWVLPPRTRFLPYLHWNPESVEPPPPVGRDELVVAHAPSVRAQKGTDAVIAAVQGLRERGFPVRLVLIEAVTHEECLRAMAGADVFVDQLLYGWYGGAAVEAMSLGIPSVAFIDERDLRWIPPEMARELPVVSATPETIEGILLDLLQSSPERRRQLCLAMRSFVMRWHAPASVAQEVIESYRT